jgi:hypothetical protein
VGAKGTGMKAGWKITLGALLVALSIGLYALQVFLFGRTADTLFYLLQDLAFLPISVLLVTLIVSQVLISRERRTLLRKLNMVIGSFFSEIGGGLLRTLTGFTDRADGLRAECRVDGSWTVPRYAQARKAAGAMEYGIDARRGDLPALSDLLRGHRSFLLVLLENPNLLEHESFTDLLWATFHLTEELIARADLHSLPPSDLDHLSGDMKRAYGRLIVEWLSYMEHLQRDYPYLFSLAARLNPMDPNARPEVQPASAAPASV